jgi:hypothetical protein
VLTLVAIPVIYSYFDDLQRADILGWFARRFSRPRAGGAAPAGATPSAPGLPAASDGAE